MEWKDREAVLRWKLDKDLELYRFYMDIAMKAAVFVTSAAGAITSYVLANPNIGVISCLGLLILTVMNIGFAVLYRNSI